MAEDDLFGDMVEEAGAQSGGNSPQMGFAQRNTEDVASSSSRRSSASSAGSSRQASTAATTPSSSLQTLSLPCGRGYDGISGRCSHASPAAMPVQRETSSKENIMSADSTLARSEESTCSPGSGQNVAPMHAASGLDMVTVKRRLSELIPKPNLAPGKRPSGAHYRKIKRIRIAGEYYEKLFESGNISEEALPKTFQELEKKLFSSCKALLSEEAQSELQLSLRPPVAKPVSKGKPRGRPKKAPATPEQAEEARRAARASAAERARAKAAEEALRAEQERQAVVWDVDPRLVHQVSPQNLLQGGAYPWLPRTTHGMSAHQNRSKAEVPIVGPSRATEGSSQRSHESDADASDFAQLLELALASDSDSNKSSGTSLPNFVPQQEPLIAMMAMQTSSGHATSAEAASRSAPPVLSESKSPQQPGVVDDGARPQNRRKRPRKDDGEATSTSTALPSNEQPSPATPSSASNEGRMVTSSAPLSSDTNAAASTNAETAPMPEGSMSDSSQHPYTRSLREHIEGRRSALQTDLEEGRSTLEYLRKEHEELHARRLETDQRIWDLQRQKSDALLGRPRQEN